MAAESASSSDPMWGALKVSDAATGEIRRVGISRREAELASFRNLLKRVSALFPSVAAAADAADTDGSYSLCWTDSDGDNITVSSDAELREAMDVATHSASRAGAAMIRFTLHSSAPPLSSNAARGAVAELPVPPATNPDAAAAAAADAAAAAAAELAQQQRKFQERLRARRAEILALARDQRSALEVGARRCDEQIKLAKEERTRHVASFYEGGRFPELVAAIQGSAFSIDNANTFVVHPGGKVTVNNEVGRWFAAAPDAIAIRIPGLSDSLALATFEPGFSTVSIALEDAEGDADPKTLRLVKAQRVPDYVPDCTSEGQKDPDVDFDICPEGTPSKVIRVRVPKCLSESVDGIDLLTPAGILLSGANPFVGVDCQSRHRQRHQHRHQHQHQRQHQHQHRHCSPHGRGRRCRGPGLWRKAQVHFGIVCDGSEMSPIVGTRYHKIGHDFDLCEAEFQKLPEQEKSQYEVIFTHGSSPVPYGSPVHFGVECDVSGMNPINGTRFHLIGANYDLCEAEFVKLPEEEKMKYEVIIHRGSERTPYAAWSKNSGTAPQATTPPEASASEPVRSAQSQSPGLDNGWVSVENKTDDAEAEGADAPTSTPSMAGKWDDQVKFLASIGFTHCEDYLIDLLEKRGGDVNAVINDICNNES